LLDVGVGDMAVTAVTMLSRLGWLRVRQHLQIPVGHVRPGVH
jgi:hypothetical protein